MGREGKGKRGEMRGRGGANRGKEEEGRCSGSRGRRNGEEETGEVEGDVKGLYRVPYIQCVCVCVGPCVCECVGESLNGGKFPCE